MLYVRDILNVCSGKLLCGNESIQLGNFCTDTRLLRKGDVYVGLRGENFNGSDFYQDAILKGASVCILNQKIDVEGIDCTVVFVPDTLLCLQELARYKRNMLDIPVIAITGSVGKTSTKDMVASVVGTKYRVHKTEGNYNNHIGVPLTILSYDNEDVMVVEMGMNHLGEIHLLSDIAKPTISIITNVGTAHIGNLGNRENILKAKLEILDGMIGKDVIINHDNDMLSSVEDELRNHYSLKTVSVFEGGDYTAVNVKEGVFESFFDVDDVCDIHVNVGGKAFIYNSLVAYAVGHVLGICDEDIKEGISHFKLSSHRLERKVSRSGIVVIDDTYNANFDSMKSSLELIGRVKDMRKIAILGDMLELGEYSLGLHRDLGDVVVENDIDFLVTVGDYSREIDKRVMELGMSSDCVVHFDREEDSYSFLKNCFHDNDIVLVKGSHGIHLTNVVNKILDI